MSIQGTVYYKEKYGYHITEKKNMESIITNGLIPMCGERSQSVGDENVAICFAQGLHQINEWIDILNYDKDIWSLELLRFNLNRRKWYISSCDYSDCYLKESVDPEYIEFGVITDSITGDVLPLNTHPYQKKLIWTPIRDYPRIGAL